MSYAPQRLKVLWVGPWKVASGLRITAKADYAVRAALELAAAPDGEPVKGEQLAKAQDIPLQFL